MKGGNLDDLEANIIAERLKHLTKVLGLLHEDLWELKNLLMQIYGKML